MRVPRVDLIHPQEVPEARDPLGPGQLQGRSAGEEAEANLFPLQVDVQARLSGPLALVEVRQTFVKTTV